MSIKNTIPDHKHYPVWNDTLRIRKATVYGNRIRIQNVSDSLPPIGHSTLRQVAIDFVSYHDKDASHAMQNSALRPRLCARR